MCVLQGLVMHRGQEHPARVLIDSGSSHQYISSEFVRKTSLEVETRRNSPHWVQVANGTYMEAPAQANFTLAMARYRTRVKARVLDMPEYDVILGMDWLRTANPVIDWQEMSIQVRDTGGELCELFPRDTTRYIRTQEATYAIDEIDPVSVAQADRILRQPGSTACLFAIRERTDPGQPLLVAEPYSQLPKVTNNSKDLQALARSYKDIFCEELPRELPPTRGYEHEIDTGEAAPINLNSYPLSPVHIEEQSRQLSQLLAQGLIQESASPWGFPVLFVKKPEGKWRMCIDFRALNAVTKKNGYPLPRIQECLDLIGQAKILSKIDLTQGYYQVRVAEGAREKTAFNTREGKFEYLAMPFGLANAPATFQTMMNRILREFIVKGFVIVYLDDIVIFSNSESEHQQHLKAVFEALRANKLYAKPSKCILAAPELEFCGHVVGNGKLQPVRSKINMITSWPVPRNVHEVRQFLGLATYYRRFVRHFARICTPLFELLKEADAEARKRKFRKIVWTASCEAAFRQLKQALTTGPTLVQPDTTRPFFIETDASEWAIGCVLLQQDPVTGRLHPVAFDGRKLQAAEINYPVHEKELLAVKYALQIWRIYIDNGHTTVIYTDHESLKYLATMRNPSKRLARWVEEFGEYQIDLRYRKGSEQVVPDAISRRPDLMGEGPRNLAAPVFMVRGLAEDTWAFHIQEFLESGTEPPEPLHKEIYEKHHEFVVIDGFLYKVTDGIRSPYVPETMRADFIERMHTEYGHLGFPGIMGIVTGRGWWHSLVTDIKGYISLCPQCQIAQRSRPGQEREYPRTLTDSNIQLFDRWAIDLIGILPQTPAGNRWIVTAIEYLTGWPVAKALPDAKAETIARFIHEDITMVYGPPREILSDNGSNLTAEVMQAYTRILGTKHKVTTPYHPRTNGKVENFNGFLGSTLTKLLSNKPTMLWDQYLPQALFAIRVRTHATNRHSPYSLLFGQRPRLPTDGNHPRPLEISNDEWQRVTDRIEQMQHARMVANQRLVDKAIAAGKIRLQAVKESPFKEGDWVLVRAESRNKFEGRWFGPYRIEKVMLLGTYKISDPQGNIVATLINGQRLISAKVTDETRKSLWNSSRIQGALRRRGVTLDESSPEVAELFEKESEDMISYDELASIPDSEWKQIERSGDRLGQVREGIENDISQPSAQDISALEDGLDEGLQRTETHETPGNIVATELATIQPNDINILPIPQATSTHESCDELLSDTMDIDAEHTPTIDVDDQQNTRADVTKVDSSHSTTEVSKRPSVWYQHQHAGFGDRERVTTRYGLRQHVARKTSF
jgi:hypothetical protein